jgi:hypothetical protein
MLVKSAGVAELYARITNALRVAVATRIAAAAMFSVASA